MMTHPQPRPGAAYFEQPTLITRFSIALLAFTLIGMGLGSALPPEFGPLALITGSIGFVAFTILENLATRRHRESTDALWAHTEQRLAQLLTDPGCGHHSAPDGMLPSDNFKSCTATVHEPERICQPSKTTATTQALESDPHLLAPDA